MASRSYYKVTVGGNDITSLLQSRLISLRISLKSGDGGDTATITIDDTNGMVSLPSDEAYVECSISRSDRGGAVIFRGKVDDVRSNFNRSAGRTITVTAKSLDTKSKAKEQKSKHVDNKSFKDAATEFAKAADIKNVKVASSLASIQREWWGMQDESFIHWANRIAQEIGATFKVSGDTAIFAERNGGTSVSGKALAAVTAAWGDNLISGSIAPVLGRPQFKQVRARYFDQKAGQWKDVKIEVPNVSSGAKATHTARQTRKDEGEAKSKTGSDKKESERNKGQGTIVIDGNASAQPEGTCVVVGVRAGIDGTYRIDNVEHSIDRGGGWTTTLSLKQPQGKAGKDTRKKKKTTGKGASK